MQNGNLYKYLTTKCKEKNIPIESLPGQMGFSRSSLYRYMKGITHMSPSVQTKFVQILGLDEEEKQEFSRLVDLSEYDSGLIDARYALDRFVFGEEKSTQKKTNVIKFAYHENDTFLRTAQEIYEMILSAVSQPDTSCSIRIINCMDDSIFESLGIFLEKLLSNSGTVKAEHLLTFADKAYLNNINTLINIIPLLKYKNYGVCYSKNTISNSGNMLFSDTVIIDIHQQDKPDKYFFISFLPEELSSSLMTFDKNTFNFILENYDSFRKNFDIALLDNSSVNLVGQQIVELNECGNSYLIKPNLCYERVPIDVYQSVLKKMTPEEFETAQKSLSQPNSDSTNAITSALAGLQKREEDSYKKQDIDIFSVSGLTEFAQTGKLSDHMSFLPSFGKDERRKVLQHIRNRNKDPKDGYTLLITRKNIFKNGYIMVAYENIGVVIEYNQEEYQQGILSNLLIKNKALSDIVSDYAKNHFPDNHALSKEETTAFLDSLIEELK